MQSEHIYLLSLTNRLNPILIVTLEYSNSFSALGETQTQTDNKRCDTDTDTDRETDTFTEKQNRHINRDK